MKIYGRTTVAAFLDDNIVYRNLRPMDDRLPDLGEITQSLGMPDGTIPRKSEPAYARVMAYLLTYARSLDAGGGDIQRLIYIGDTRLNDGTAFTNLCRAGNWPGIAFIGSETPGAAAVEVVHGPDDQTLYLANRWSMLPAFDRHCRDHDFPIDVQTAVVLDLDKTTLGARGRNDHVINAARVAAVRQTVSAMLGEDFDPAGFERAYTLLNQTEFHPFTTDNQDYLAYLCLIVGQGLVPLPDLMADIRSGTLVRFTQFLDVVERRVADLPERLRALHDDIYRRVQAGDPTPFKAFRYNEYLTTTGRMGQLPPEADAKTLLAQEIVITQEVREIAARWKEAGALLFGLSDKPDEASIPTEALASQGYQAIHQTETHVVGAGAEG